MKTLGIKYQLRLTTLIPVTLVAILFAIFFNWQYHQDLKQHTSRLGEAFVRQLLPSAQLALLRQDVKTLQGLTHAATVNSEVKSVAFYNAAGDLIVFTGGTHAKHLKVHEPVLMGDILKTRQLNAHTLNFIAPVTIPKFNLYSSSYFPTFYEGATHQAFELLGWLSIDIDIQSLIVKRYKMYIVTIFITLLGLLIALSVHFFLSKPIYLPLQKLSRSMKQIMRNEFETQIKTNGPSEIGVVARGCAHLQEAYLNTINELNGHIEIATNDLQQALELLEEKNIELSLDKKKMEERVKQKSEFVANMSHEIRTPMNGILGFTNLLMESRLDGLQLEYVKTIQTSAKDLLSTINDILDYSKMEAGKLRLECIPLDIRSCIDEVLVLFSPMANKKGIDLIPITSDEVPRTVLGDPLRIKQILSNLVSNAIKFTDQGYVVIRTHIENQSEKNYSLSLNVIDTGVGIAKEDQGKLFNAFNQADTSISRRFGGSGLGLTICKKLAEQMGGRITLESELSKGTTFSVRLLVEKYKAYEIERHQTHHLSQLKVLCFDDNPLYLESLCLGLKSWDVETIPVSHFNQLKSALKKNSDCDLALVNVNLGCEQQIATLIKKEQMPIYFLTKYPIDDFKRLGAQGVLYKPVNIQKLYETLDGFVKNASFAIKENSIQSLRTEMKEIMPEVLIAEDNPVNRLLLESLLSDYAKMTTVEDGMAAIETAAKKRFDIILLDLQMPRKNGLESARIIKETSSINRETPIILISATLPEEVKAHLSESGIALYLQKPVDEASLLKHMLELFNTPKTAWIDWHGTLLKLSDNKALARDYLTQFMAELVISIDEIEQQFKAKDLKALSNVIHKLKGACCFCEIPKLFEAILNVEAKLSSTNASQQKEAITNLLSIARQMIKDNALAEILEPTP